MPSGKVRHEVLSLQANSSDAHSCQKRQRDPSSNDLDTSKPSAIFVPTGGRLSTLSIALPGSIIANAKSHDQKTTLAGTIARALAVFCVDEVIIFNDEPAAANSHEPGEDEYTAFSDPCHFLAHLLSYLETPAYLRKALFSIHPNLRTAGNLPSLDMPHHLRAGEWCDYREGVTVNSSRGATSVDVGLAQKRLVEDLEIPPNTRVTLKLDPNSDSAEAVAPTDPREVEGYYWGYTVRRCESLSAVFTECPFDGGYTASLGMSERGGSLRDVEGIGIDLVEAHVLLVFGGVAGLEHAAQNDTDLQNTGITPSTVNKLFDFWVNVCPGQGSRTIRTEEAIWLGLMGLKTNGHMRRAED